MFQNLERGFNRGSIDFLYLVFLILSILYGFAWAFGINHLGIIFKFVIFYMYGRTNSDHEVQLNFIPVRAPFVIWYAVLDLGSYSFWNGS